MREKTRKLIGAVAIILFMTGCSSPAIRNSSELQAENVENKTEMDVATIKDNTVAEAGQHIEINDVLDDNLSIQAELTMPLNTLYEYSAELKVFDYDNALEIIQPSSEGTIGGETGSVVYRRNDISSHLDTYCTYAAEQGLATDGDLSFLSQEDAIAKLQNLLVELNVGGELGTPEVVAMTGDDFRNTQKVIMEDETY